MLFGIKHPGLSELLMHKSAVRTPASLLNKARYEHHDHPAAQRPIGLPNPMPVSGPRPPMKMMRAR